MKFHQLFLAAFHEPKKLAAFRLLPIGKVMRYIFIFIFIMTSLSFLRFTFGDSNLFEASPELMEYSKTIGGLIYPMAFIFQLVISTFYLFVRISLFAYLGTLTAKLMKRRAEFRHVWRTAAIAITVPLIVTLAIDFLPSFKTAGIIITSIVHLLYIVSAIKYYPKSAR
ncbi:DUF1189 family protein [Sporosarcina contaminans]|uniref:DUF1189 family protein n=1 Tax=Sporosarcina contaminans TaxID=633403 RepID=A0ABW3TT14_9BACL